MERDYAHLIQLIREERRVVGDLVAVLEQEREALTARDVIAIENVTREKTLLLDTVERASAARTAWTREAGMDPAGDEFEAFIASPVVHARAPELATAWEDLCSALRVAHRENLVNGRIISRSRQSLGQLLNILRGQVDTPRLYGRGGRPGQSGDGGEIARA